MTLPKKYNASESEQAQQQRWNELGVYAWQDDKPKDQTYVIDTPPPTVSGLLHMGHIFSYTQADFIARYQRMTGKDVFYPMGFDDNGLPTERLVEKNKKVRATSVGREAFIAMCEEVSEEARKEFRTLFESVALSVDWKQEYHTVSERSRRLSQLSFLDLHHKGHVTRYIQPMLWDPVDQTAIAQAEIEDKEQPSAMNDILFGIDGSDEKITIGTTRPELLPACVAVFYHPDDERYQHLKGKTAVSPLFNVRVPLLPDEDVKIDKGTGLVMCCTFGDEMDITWWRRHKLPARVVLNKYGKLELGTVIVADSVDSEDKISAFIFNQILADDTDASSARTSVDDASIVDSRNADIEAFAAAWEHIKGKKVSNVDKKHPGARQIILGLLKDDGLLVKQTPITHAVKCAERSGAALEILPTYQWFVKILDKKEALKEKAAQCSWYPDHMKVRMDQWIDGLSWDWCISRQRYFGVPFPVWYSKRQGEEGKIILPDPSQLPVNPLIDLPKGYTRDEVDPESDVMDTWATSAISPQLSSWAISDELMDPAGSSARHAKLFPADLRPQAHEIIRTWAFYTLAKAHLHQDVIPWKNLMISGWCLASDKTKMSKSKGNVVTPVGLIEEKSADVIRYWASTSRLGADTAYSEDVLSVGKRLINKLWNATKFAAIQLDAIEEVPLTAFEDEQKGIISHTLDRWIISQLHDVVATATASFEKYEYSQARAAVEDFFYRDFCDQYLELSKTRAYGEEGSISKEDSLSAAHTIYHCLDAVLRLFAPFIPHITDELYTAIFADKVAGFELPSIHARGTWPLIGDYFYDEYAVSQGASCVMINDVIRKLKAEKNVSVKWPLEKVSIICHEDGALDESTLSDLAFGVNALHLSDESLSLQDASTLTDDEAYTVSVLFAKEAS